MTNEVRFAVVEIHVSPWEAHVSRGLLESEGIPVLLHSEHQIWANWPMSLTFGGIRVLVPVQRLAQARDLLALRDSGELENALSAEQPSGRLACMVCGSTTLREVRDGLSVILAFVLLFLCRASYPPVRFRRCASCGSSRCGEP